MNAHRTFVLVSLLVLAALLWFLWPRSKPVLPLAIESKPKSAAQSPAPPPPSSFPKKDGQGRLLPLAPHTTQLQDHREPDPEAVKRFRDAYLTPISFYGKVVDERDNPIEGATVKLNAADKPWQNSSEYDRTSDAEGLFSITGIRGAGLAVFVSKAGYYPTAESRRGFTYGAPRGKGDGEIPTPDAPAIFVLHKMGETAPLVHQRAKDFPIDGKGTPVDVNLSIGAQGHSNGEQIRVEVWSDDPTYGARGPYGWKARVSVPGGGLVERKGQFDFEAPNDGYVPAFEISMAPNADRWRDGFERQFFAKLADGRFARIKLDLATSGLFFRLESYLNPTLGSQNLEFDPTKEVKR
jgi:hypothetical protein